MASPSAARRIFPISDWAPAHEALYSETDNDSSIDTLPFPHKPRQSSYTPSPSSSSCCAQLPRRSNTTKQRRSMSLPWRPKSQIISPEAIEAKFRDYSLGRSHTTAQLAAAPPSSASTPGPNAGLDAGFVDDEPTCSYFTGTGTGTGTGSGKGKGKGRISGIFRRASVSIKGLVHRRTSIATDTFQEPGDTVRHHQRSGHTPSHSHHHIQTTPTSPLGGSSPFRVSTQQSRPTTSHAINATWHRLRQATSFRHSRVLYGDFTMDAHEVPYQPQDDIPYSVPRPGVGGEPPVIPRNGGSGARAAAAAWQHDMFPTVHPQGRADMPVLKNKRLTLDSTQTDRESGIGIAVTSSDSDASDMPDLDMVVQSEGAHLLYPCAPEISRIDFIDRLPAELAIQVLAHLDAADLARSSLVSRSWREMVSCQHIWRESYLREKTCTYATSSPVQPGTGLGVPAVQPNINWKDAYRVSEELSQRWKRGHATSIYLNGHSDSIYCLQFDEYGPLLFPRVCGVLEASHHVLTIPAQAKDHHRLTGQDDPHLGHAYAGVQAGHRPARGCQGQRVTLR
jgi:F-box and WD-40 domain protein 1/11